MQTGWENYFYMWYLFYTYTDHIYFLNPLIGLYMMAGVKKQETPDDRSFLLFSRTSFYEQN
jgi:hypothetical protein